MMKLTKGLCWCAVSCAVAMLIPAMPARANEPPTARQIAQYKADGTYATRLARALQIGNQKVDPNLAARAEYRLSQLSGLPLDGREPPPASQGLPTTGTPKILVMLVDFPDYPHSANQPAADVNSKFFGDGDPGLYPFESLQSFYRRSSYNQLEIQGNTLGWYRAKYNRSYYEDAAENLIMEALGHFDQQGHDFTQYDNNGDGTIDTFFLKWTGPDTGWSGFWWAYQTQWWYNPSYTIDGKHLKTYVWSWISNPEGQPYEPQTDIHETGHALGLPDYYDYDDTVGPDGGVGGLDMMDANSCDHNCFSKFMLDWLTPTVIAAGSSSLNLNPSGTSQDCVLLMPQAVPDEVFHEYFMAQYREQLVGNDPYALPNTGLVLWHIDATLDEFGWDFLYDNSTAPHKLLRLMEADGLEEIENGNGYADAGDFYLPPATLGPVTTPNSHDYLGADTHVLVDQLTDPAETAGARFSIDNIDAVDDDQRTSPSSTARLAGARPNPFTPQTTIHLSLVRAQHVRLLVLDMTGRQIIELADGDFAAGDHPVRWDGRDSAGREMPSGPYVVYMISDDGTQTSKMLLVR